MSEKIQLTPLSSTPLSSLDYATRFSYKRISERIMPKPGRVTAPGFLLRHARARPQQEGQPMPFQKGQSRNPAGRPRGSRNRPRARVQGLLIGNGIKVPTQPTAEKSL
jgi:hypothetical protein